MYRHPKIRAPEKSKTILDALASSILANVPQTVSAHINLRIPSPPPSEEHIFHSRLLGASIIPARKIED
jgi:hypothetical protein